MATGHTNKIHAQQKVRYAENVASQITPQRCAWYQSTLKKDNPEDRVLIKDRDSIKNHCHTWWWLEQ